MSNLLQRIITGLVLVIVITGAILAGGLYFLALVLAICLLALLEFYDLFKSANLSPGSVAGCILSISLLLCVASVVSGRCTYYVLSVPCLMISFIFFWELFKHTLTPFGDLAYTLTGVAYITLPRCFFVGEAYIPVGAGDYRYEVVLGHFIILWSYDSGAYWVGKVRGKRPLWSRLSPVLLILFLGVYWQLYGLFVSNSPFAFDLEGDENNGNAAGKVAKEYPVCLFYQ